MALSCHLSMHLLCQEMKDVCKGSSKSLDYPRSLCTEWQALCWNCHSRAFTLWTGCDNRKHVVTDEGGTYAASPYELCWCVCGDVLSFIRATCVVWVVFNAFELTLARGWKVLLSWFNFPSWS